MDSKIIIGFDASGVNDKRDKCCITIIHLVGEIKYLISSKDYTNVEEFKIDLKSSERLFNVKANNFTPR